MNISVPLSPPTPYHARPGLSVSLSFPSSSFPSRAYPLQLADRLPSSLPLPGGLAKLKVWSASEGHWSGGAWSGNIGAQVGTRATVLVRYGATLTTDSAARKGFAGFWATFHLVP